MESLVILLSKHSIIKVMNESRDDIRLLPLEDWEAKLEELVSARPYLVE